MNILPCNRYLLVSPSEAEAEVENTILLPADFRARASHIMAKVLAIAEDSKFKGCEGKNVIVNNNLVEELDICGSIYHFILENHVIGMVAEN